MPHLLLLMLLTPATTTVATTAATVLARGFGHQRATYVEYKGRTAHLGHGAATEIDSDATAPTGYSAAECKARCDADPACGCVVLRPSSGKCWKRGGCVPVQFSPGKYITYSIPPAPPHPPAAFEWIRAIEASKGGEKFTLNASTYLIDRQYQLPRGTEIRGAGSESGGGPRTVVKAVGQPFNKNCGANAINRKGFLLNDDTYIGGLHFVGMETGRYDCLTGPVETPGCANTQTRFTQPPTDKECGGDVGVGHGVRNATLEDFSVEAFTTQNAFFMAPTKMGARVSSDITVRGVHCNGTWADGINIHGQHHGVLVTESDIRYSGDDSFATWSVGAGQTNISFVNNHARTPHQGGGPRCAVPNPPSNCRPSGCFANYGGQASSFINNSGTGCYQDAVVIFGNVRFGLFGGAWNKSSSALVQGNVGMNQSCAFLDCCECAPRPECCGHTVPCTRGSCKGGCVPFPGHIVCER